MNKPDRQEARRASLATKAIAADLSAAGRTPHMALSAMLDGADAKGASGAADWPDNDFRDRALQALEAAPIGHARLFGVDQVEHILALPGEVCLSWIAGADEAVFAAPLTPVHAGTAVLEMLAPTEAAPRQPLELNLPADALMAFAAAIDHLRLAYVASLVQRCPVQSFALSREDFLRQYEDSRSFDDNRWLCALVGHLAPDLARSAPQSIDSDLGGLCSAGLLKLVDSPEGTLFLPDAALIRLGLNLTTPLPAALLEARGRRSLILCGRALWGLEIRGDKATLSGKDVWTWSRKCRRSSVGGKIAGDALRGYASGSTSIKSFSVKWRSAFSPNTVRPAVSF